MKDFKTAIKLPVKHFMQHLANNIQMGFIAHFVNFWVEAWQTNMFPQNNRDKIWHLDDMPKLMDFVLISRSHKITHMSFGGKGDDGSSEGGKQLYRSCRQSMNRVQRATGKDNMLTALHEACLKDIWLIHVLKHAKMGQI